jgi:hypothetical protein
LYLISRSAGLTLPIRDTKTEYNTATGVVVKVHPALSARFEPSAGVPDWAREAAKTLPNWGNGLGHNWDPYKFCGILDTDEEAKRQNWTPEDKAFVEKALLNSTDNGVQYVIAEAPKTAKPWPKYDDITGAEAAEQIAWQVDQLGLDPKSVRRYERENADREGVIAALEDLIAKDAEDVVGVISA